MNISEAFIKLQNGLPITRNSWKEGTHLFLAESVGVVLISRIPNSSTYYVLTSSDLYASDWKVKE